MREFEGLPWPEAVATARARGRAVRVLRPGEAVTLDLRPDRLNVHLDGDDRLDHLSAG
ncbi:I78 family peptidase inhibitor [Kineococcus sp. SYSU DK002]|uniref:I78 family peptidase inhibitor n=1 Tax=Kineococcus sp. SYSU DK002 TaxID=3383123 RepID=UPI003D7D10F0